MFYYITEDGTLFTSEVRLDDYEPISQAEYERLKYNDGSESDDIGRELGN